MSILCFLVGVIIGNIIVCIFSVNNKSNKCLHCDEEEGVYCETCYQDLISENARLQLLNSGLIKERENIIKHIPRID